MSSELAKNGTTAKDSDQSHPVPDLRLPNPVRWHRWMHSALGDVDVDRTIVRMLVGWIVQLPGHIPAAIASGIRMRLRESESLGSARARREAQ